MFPMLVIKSVFFLITFIFYSNNLISQSLYQIYTTPFQASATAPSWGGTATGTVSSAAFFSAALSGWSGTYTNTYFSTSSSTGSGTITFSSALPLVSNGTDKGTVVVNFGHTSAGKGFTLYLNGSPLTSYTATALKTGYVVTYTIPIAQANITSLQCKGSSTSGLYCFSVSVNTYTTCTTPTLSGASQSSTVCSGTSATINMTGLVASSNANAIDYTINGVAQTQITGVASDASGNASFTSVSLSSSNNGQTLQITKITNGSCNTSFTKNVTLSVNTPISIGTNPSATSVCAGSSTTMGVSSVSGTSPTYQWQYATSAGGTYANVTNGTPIGTSYTNTTTATLGIATSGSTPAGSNYFYQCVVAGTSPCGNVTSGNAALTVNAPIAIGINPSATIVCAGSSTSMSVSSVTGTSPTYQWQYATSAGGTYANVVNGTPSGVTYSNATTATLGISTANSTPSGSSYFYQCVVSGTSPCGSVTSGNAALTVNAPIVIGSNPTASSVNINGASTTFSVSSVTGTSPTYQWKHATTAGGVYTNVVNGTPTGVTYSGANTATLSLSASGTASTGTNDYYQCDVAGSSPCGSVSSGNAALTINAASGQTPPSLSATANQSVDNDYIITYSDDIAWDAAVTGITIDGGSVLSGTTYFSTPSAGIITLHTSTIPALQIPGSHTIVIIASTYLNATLNSASNVSGVPVRLSISSIVSTQVAGTSFGVTLNSLDQFGNPANVSSNTNVTLATSGSGVLSSNSGIINTGNSSVTLAGVNYTKAEAVTFTASASGLTTSSASNTVTFSAATAMQLSIATIASAQTVGTPFSVIITAQDIYGNTANSSAAVTFASSGSGILSGNSGSLSSGVLTLTSVSYTKAETVTFSASASGLTSAVSNSVTFSTGTPTKLAISSISSSQNAGTIFSVTVSAQDAYGNIANSSANVTLASSGSGILSGNTGTLSSGTLTLTNVNYTKAEVVTFTASASGLTNSDASNSVTFNAGLASQVVITTVPTAPATNGGNLVTQPIVKIEDANGNVVTGSTANVTVSILGTNALINGTTTVSASAGIATFSGVSIATSNGTTQSATLTFSSLGLTSATSGSITIPAYATSAASFFRSNGTGGGTWTTANTWQSSPDNINWFTATTAPTSTALAIDVRSGDVVGIASAVTIGIVTTNIVSATVEGELDINTAGTLTIANGSSLTVTGTLNNTLTTTSITTTGTLAFGSNGIFQLSGNGGTIPAATWASTSTIKITGITTGANALTVTAPTSGNYGSLWVDIPGYTAATTFKFFKNFPSTVTLAGDLTLGRTGGRILQLPTGTNGNTVNVLGNVNVYAGDWIINNFTTVAWTINGNLNIDATYSFGTSTGYSNPTFEVNTSGSTSTTVNLKGNLNMTTGVNAGTGVTQSAVLFSSGSNTQSFNFNGSNNQSINVVGVGTFTGATNITVANTGTAPNNIVTLNGNFTVGGTLTLTSGTFAVGSNTLSLNGPSIVNPANLVLTSSSSLSFGGSSVSVIIPSNVTSLTNLTIANNTGVTSSSNITVSGTMSVTGVFIPAPGNIIGGGTLSGTGTVKVTKATGSGDFLGQYTLNTLTLSALTVEFAGASAQGVNANTFGSLKINNSNGVTAAGAITVNGTLTLSSGLLTTTTSNLLTLGSGATVSGGSSTSFVNGPMQNTISVATSTPKVFPIGKLISSTNYYSPITLTVTQLAASATTYQAEAFFGGSMPSYTLPTTLSVVSANRYYTLSSSANNISTAAITLNYDANDATGSGLSLVTAANIRIAGSSGWIDLGGNGSATASGSITSTNSFTSLGDFVIANALVLGTPPSLTAAASPNNTLDGNINIQFTDDGTWGSKINTVKLGTTSLVLGTDYSLSIVANPGTSTLSLIPGSAITTPFTTQTITVSATSYNDATVSQTITVGVPAKLIVKTQPVSSTFYAGAFTTQPAVYIQDQYGNATTSTASVTVAPSVGWTIGGTTTVAAINGTATFTGLAATASSDVTGAALSFTSGLFTGTTSNTFTVVGPAVYYWVGGTASSNWITSAVWSKTRGGTGAIVSNPLATDTYIFDGTNIGAGATGSVNVTLGASINVGQILLQNSQKVTFTPSTTVTVSVNGMPNGADFVVGTGSKFITAGSASTFALATGATGSISDSVTFATGSNTPITAADSAALVFNSGSVVTFNLGSSSTYPFGQGKDSSVIFKSGSKLLNSKAGDPFGGTGHSVVIFQTGSSYELAHSNSAALIFSGRTFSNFIFSSTSTASPAAGSAGITFDSILVSGTKSFTIAETGSLNHIRGHIKIGSAGGSLIFAPASASTFTLDGLINQVIADTGTLTIGSNQTIQVNNSNGVTIGLPVTSSGSLSLSTGNVTLGNNNLTVASVSGGSSSSYIDASGTGKFSIASVPTSATIFPIGTATYYAPLSFSGGTANRKVTTGVKEALTNAPSIPTNVVNLEWSILASAATSPTVTFQYNAANKASAFSASTPVLGTYVSSYSESIMGAISGSDPYSVSTSTTIALPIISASLYAIGNQYSFNCVAGTYVGANNGDASVSSNWCGGVPSAASNVIISSNAPLLTTNLSVNNLTLNGGLNLNGNSLTINGSISGTGTITGSSTSSVNVLGSGGTLYFNQGTPSTTNLLNNLTINTAGTVTLGNALNVLGTVTPTAGTLASAGNLTLISNASGTARVDQVLGSITGNVSIQRYISSKSARRYSFIGSPVAQSVRSAWQNQIYITGSGTGGAICGSTSGDGGTTDKYNSNGFDVSQVNAATVMNYTASTTNGSHYVGISNTESTSLTPGVGYVVNIRGNRNSQTVSCSNQLANTSPTAPEEVTLSATGTLTQGDVSVTLNDPFVHKFTLLANPYPSQISFSAFQSANSGTISNKMWTYSPFGSGNYTTYSNGAIVNAATNYDNINGNYLAVGQAFFVEGITAGSVAFHENQKVSGLIPNTQYFGTNNIKTIRVAFNNAAGSRLDEIIVRYNNRGSKDYVSAWDANSLSIVGQSLVSLKGTNRLAIATHPDDATVDTTQLAVVNKAGSYSLSFNQLETIDSAQSIILIDKFLGTQTNVRKNSVYPFNITSDTASRGINRFKIVLSAAAPLAVSFTNIEASKTGKDVSVKWQLADEKNIVTYTVERSTDAINFEAFSTAKAISVFAYTTIDASVPNGVSTVYYRVKAVDNMGKANYSKIVSVKVSTSNAQVLVYPNPVQNKLNVSLNNASAGVYGLRVSTTSGVLVFSKNNVSLSASNASFNVSNLASGAYILEATDKSGSKLISKFIKQ